MEARAITIVGVVVITVLVLAGREALKWLVSWGMDGLAQWFRRRRVREVREELLFQAVKQLKADITGLQKGFIVLAGRDKKSWDLLRTLIRHVRKHQDTAALAVLHDVVTRYRDTAYLSAEDKRAREVRDALLESKLDELEQLKAGTRPTGALLPTDLTTLQVAKVADSEE